MGMFDYDQGFRDGLTAYAWWKDGVQMVGNCGATLEGAVEKRIATWNYGPLPSGFPDAAKCPKDIVESLTLYRDDGCPVGGFLDAVLANDLADAFGRGDVDNCAAMGHIVAWVYRYMPPKLWHSAERVKAHIARMEEARAHAEGEAQLAEEEARNEG